MKPILPLLLLAAVPASAADGLQATIMAALDRSPALAGARAREREARAGGEEAFFSRFPRLSVGASAMTSDDPLFAFGSLLRERRVTQADFAPGTLNRPGYRTSVRGGLELGMPLFAGFELTRARELARLAEKEAAAWGGSAGQAVRLRAVDGYVRSLRDRRILAELDERIASGLKEVQSAERLARQGLALGSDHQAALAILSGLKARRARAAAEKAAHDAELSVLTGGRAPEPAGALSTWTPPLEEDEALVAAALADRPDLHAARARVSGAGVRERGAAESLLPVVDAFASVENSADGINSGAASRLLGLRVKVPFGDPAYRSRRGRAKAAAEAEAASRSQAEDEVRAEVLGRAAGLRGLAAVIPALDESLSRARRSLELVRPLYREGRQSVMEVLRAEEAVAQVQEARLDALYRQLSGWAALRAALGRLGDADIEQIARSLENAP